MGEVIRLRVASSEEAVTLQSASGSLAVEAVSPRVSITKVDGGTKLDITDVAGTKSAILPDGSTGPQGPKGDTGATGPQGVPGDDYVLTAQDKADIASMVDLSGKADKVSGATAGNFAALDANGNLTDSRKKPGDFVTGQALANALSGKQDTLTFDSVPAALSSNPVTSDGVYNGINNLRIDLESDIHFLNTTVSGHTSDIIDLNVKKQGILWVTNVSGTDPTIQAKSDHRYVCGTLSTLTIYPLGIGVTDVVFTSGSTPTVLTVVAPVKWPSWFDPTALEASTTYEINILDGELGAVGKWT